MGQETVLPRAVPSDAREAAPVPPPQVVTAAAAGLPPSHAPAAAPAPDRTRSRSRSRRRSASGQRKKALTDGSVSGKPAASVPVLSIEDDPLKQQDKPSEEDDKRHGTCPLGHGLVPIISVDLEDMVACDICGCKKKSDSSILRCKTCNYHLCKPCSEWGTSLFSSASNGRPMPLMGGQLALTC